MRRDEEQWVHERDYGSVGGLFEAVVGLFQIVFGIVLLVVSLFRRK